MIGYFRSPAVICSTDLVLVFTVGMQEDVEDLADYNDDDGTDKWVQCCRGIRTF